MGAPGDRECRWPIEWDAAGTSRRYCLAPATHAVLWPDGAWPASRCEEHAHEHASETRALGMVVCPVEDRKIIQHGLLVRRAIDPEGVRRLMGPTPFEYVETVKGNVALAVPPSHERDADPDHEVHGPGPGFDDARAVSR